jgi:hypothetical protein
VTKTCNSLLTEARDLISKVNLDHEEVFGEMGAASSGPMNPFCLVTKNSLRRPLFQLTGTSRPDLYYRDAVFLPREESPGCRLLVLIEAFYKLDGVQLRYFVC